MASGRAESDFGLQGWIDTLVLFSLFRDLTIRRRQQQRQRKKNRDRLNKQNNNYDMKIA